MGKDAFKKLPVLRGSKFDDVLGFRASITLFNFKTHAVPFAERFESGHVNPGMMDKQVLPVFLRNKTKSFSVAKPFYHAFSQNTPP